MTIFERLDQQYPGVLKYQGGLGCACNMISDVHRHRGEPAESLAFAQKAQALLERLVSEHPNNLASRIDLAKSQNNIGRIFNKPVSPSRRYAFRRG